MYDNNLFIKYVIIHNTKHGCIKQYRCANLMWLLYILPFISIVIPDRFIKSPGHGRSKIYGINGSDKTYLKQKMLMIVTEESNN